MRNIIVINPTTKETVWSKANLKGNYMKTIPTSEHKFAITFYHPIKKEYLPPTFCKTIEEAEKELKKYTKLSIGFMSKSERWTNEQLEQTVPTLQIYSVEYVD